MKLVLQALLLPLACGVAIAMAAIARPDKARETAPMLTTTSPGGNWFCQVTFVRTHNTGAVRRFEFCDRTFQGCDAVGRSAATIDVPGTVSTQCEAYPIAFCYFPPPPRGIYSSAESPKIDHCYTDSAQCDADRVKYIGIAAPPCVAMRRPID